MCATRPGADHGTRGRSLVNRLHTMSVTVEDTTDDRQEMAQILRAGLADFDLRISHDDQDDQHRTVLTLTVEAGDLWLAVLIAMHAVVATGYHPVALTAAPAAGPPRTGPLTPGAV